MATLPHRKKRSMFPMHMFKLIRSNILFWSSFKTCAMWDIEKEKGKKTSIVKCKFETREQEISSLIFERCLVGGHLPSILLAANIGSGIQNPKITVAFIFGWISLNKIGWIILKLWIVYICYKIYHTWSLLTVNEHLFHRTRFAFYLECSMPMPLGNQIYIWFKLVSSSSRSNH